MRRGRVRMSPPSPSARIPANPSWRSVARHRPGGFSMPGGISRFGAGEWYWAAEV